MREVCVGVLVVCAAAAQTSGWHDEATQTILTNARNALGGDVELGAVRALRLIGQGSRVLGTLRVAGDVVIEMAFPDRYLRVDRISLGGRSSEISAGFNDGRLIQRAAGFDGARIEPVAALPPDLRARSLRSALAAARQEVGLLLLGFFCSGSDSFPVEFARVGSAESPDGTADVLDLRAASGLTAQLFIDGRSHLPLMVSWMGPDVLAPTRALGTGQRAGVPPSLETLLAQVQALVEHRMYFADYRSVGALKWPFRVRRSVGGQITEELTFERLIVNPAIDARTFDPER